MSDVIECNICRYKSVQHKCDNCGFMSCSKCSYYHVMDETCKLLQESPFHLCKSHDRLINGYCEICAELTCDQCLTKTHVNHEILCLTDAAKLIKEKIIHFMEQFEIEDTKARSSIEKLPDFNTHLLSLETKIWDRSSVWKALISETEKGLLTYINEQRDMYEQYCTKRQIYIECIQKAKSSVADLDTFKCPLKIFSSWKKIFQEFKNHDTFKMPLYLSFKFREMRKSEISNLFGRLIDDNDGQSAITDADIEHLSLDFAQCKLSNDTANRYNCTCKEETGNMHSEITRLRNEADHQIFKLKQQVETMEKENIVIKADNERLSKELETMSGHNNHMESLEKQNEQMTEEITKLKNEVQETPRIKEHEQTLKMETARMKDEIARLNNREEQHLKVMEDNVTLQQETAGMKDEISRLRNGEEEHLKLMDQTKSLQTQYEQMKAEITTLRNEVKETSKIKEQKNDLSKANSQMKSEIRELQTKLEQSCKIQTQNFTLKSEVLQMADEIQKKSKCRDDLLNAYGILLKTIDGVYDLCGDRTLTKAEDNPTTSKKTDNIKYVYRLQSIMNYIIEINNKLVKREDEIKDKCQQIAMLTKKQTSSKNKSENKNDKGSNEDWQHQKEKMNSMLKEKDESIRLLRTEKDDLQNRFSSIAGEKLTKGNPGIANLGDPNRPMKIGEKYGELYDNEWTDAMECIPVSRLLFPHLQQAEIDEVVVRHLCLILRCCYTECLSIAQEQLKSVVHTMQLDIDEFIDLSSLPVCKDVTYFRRQNCAKFSTYLYKEKVLLAKISSANWDYSNKNDDLIRTLAETEFFQKCVQLCWSMVIQDPVMYLDDNLPPGTAYNKSMYKEFTESGNKVNYVVWPALFLHKDGPLLYKGVVQAYK